MPDRSASANLVESVVVNMIKFAICDDDVRGCQAGRVTLSPGESIPVSRLRERELTQALLRHMKERDI